MFDINAAYQSVKDGAFNKAARYSNHDANVLLNAKSRLTTMVWQQNKLIQDANKIADNILCIC